MNRRRLLGGVVAGAGLFCMARLPAGATASTTAGSGQVQERATRLPHPSLPATLVKPKDGEILFPILVGETDRCYVLNNFGDCRSRCSRRHEGVDIMADEGMLVISASAGKIIKKYDDNGRKFGPGNGWTIKDEENNVAYRYFHLADHAIDLSVGDTVELGQIIGTVGETGTSGAGTAIDNFHLHFEWRPNDIPKDSFSRLQRPEFVDF